MHFFLFIALHSSVLDEKDFNEKGLKFYDVNIYTGCIVYAFIHSVFFILVSGEVFFFTRMKDQRLMVRDGSAMIRRSIEVCVHH